MASSDATLASQGGPEIVQATSLGLCEGGGTRQQTSPSSSSRYDVES